MKKDIPIIGFLLGIVMPVLGFFVVFALLRQGQSLGEFLALRNLSKIISLSILANLIPFLYYTNRRMDYAARGVFIATMLFAAAIILLKILA